MGTSPFVLLVTGAAGRMGRLLRAGVGLQGGALAGRDILWQARKPGPGIDLAWDIGRAPAPDLPQDRARPLVVLHLAGKTSGSAAELADNEASARAMGAWAAARGARFLFMSSAAVYAAAPHDLSEDSPTDPPGAYGAAKLAAEAALRAVMPAESLTVLRLANLAGGDMLFGNIRAGLPITLDPIAGQEGGPLRSYIGPLTLARVLAALVDRLAEGQALPPVLNLAQPGAVAMADILRATGCDWRFGPPRAGAVARVTLDVQRLMALVPLPPASAEALVGEVAALAGALP